MATERSVERRVVSVLFADLVGFTSLSEELDAEDVTLVQDSYFEVVRETVARHGGRALAETGAGTAETLAEAGELERSLGDRALPVDSAPWPGTS